MMLLLAMLLATSADKDAEELTRRKKEALKQLFTRQRPRNVPVIYNRESELYRKYLRGRFEDKEEENEVESVPGPSLEEQLEAIEVDLKGQVDETTTSKASGKQEHVEDPLQEVDVDNEQPRNEREPIEQPSKTLSFPLLRGSFVSQIEPVRQPDVHFLPPLPYMSQLPPRRPSLPQRPSLSRRPSLSFSPPLATPETPDRRPLNVYLYNGLLFRKGQNEDRGDVDDLDTSPSIVSSASHQRPLTDIFGGQVATTQPPFLRGEVTLWRGATGTTLKPHRRDKPVRFKEPELMLPLPTEASRPPGTLPAPEQARTATTPLPGGVYYKDPPKGFTAGEVYYKKTPKAIRFPNALLS